MSKRLRYIQALVGGLGLGFVGIAACSSNQSATGGRHGASPQGLGDVGDAGLDIEAGDGGADAKVSPDGGGFKVAGPLFPPGFEYPTQVEIVEEKTGLKLTPEEKEIVGICYRRPWSKNVPDRDCTMDNQCGDGFCDRGHCSAVYTCGQDLGFRCDAPTQCYDLLCIDGRCRSCASNDECAKKFNNPDMGCEPERMHPPGRHCAEHVPTEKDLKFLCDEGPENTKPPYCKRLRRTP